MEGETPFIFNKEHFIQLTNSLYQLTLLFPKKEPLRYKMRELADDILAKFAEAGPPQIEGELEVLDSFFAVAVNQNWVSPQELLNIQKEYSKLRDGLKPSNAAGPRRNEEFNGERMPINLERREDVVRVGEAQQKIAGSNLPFLRHGKILEVLREKGKAQAWEIKQIFPEVTKRTIRRDFEFLLRQGKIERMGQNNDTFYRLLS